MTAEEFVTEQICDLAGTYDADHKVIEAAVAIILAYSHVRKCWKCNNVALHRDNVRPHVLCKKCGSQDTRLVPSKSQKR